MTDLSETLFRKQLQDQSIRIHKSLSPDCQVMLFSATYDKDVMDFAENIVPNPVVSIAVFKS
jgi:superfamily II DNA/RNA helicase